MAPSFYGSQGDHGTMTHSQGEMRATATEAAADGLGTQAGPIPSQSIMVDAAGQTADPLATNPDFSEAAMAHTKMINAYINEI